MYWGHAGGRVSWSNCDKKPELIAGESQVKAHSSVAFSSLEKLSRYYLLYLENFPYNYGVVIFILIIIITFLVAFSSPEKLARYYLLYSEDYYGVDIFILIGIITSALKYILYVM